MKNWMQKLEEEFADDEPTIPSVRNPFCEGCTEPTAEIACAPAAAPLPFDPDEWEVETIPEIGHHELGGEGGF